MDSKNRLEHILHCLVEYRKLWLLPAIVGVIVATGYAFFIKSETWTSRQTMLIRDDLLGETFKPGQFLSEEAMKSAQETVLETARRPEVIRATLEKIGPSRKSLLGLGGVPADWPSHSTIEDFRGSITFESANGGEFGKSDVIVLAAKTSNPERSVKFMSVLLDEVDSRLSEVRASQFESMESELEATCESALTTRSDLEDRIKAMDASFGTNISTVQSMNERAAGSPSAFDNKLNQIRADRRLAVSQMASLKSIKSSLQNSGSSLELATSRELLASQPALADLVSGLAKAKADLADAESKYQDRHANVKEGRAKVASMQRQLIDAIPATLRGLDGQIAVLEERIGILDETMAENAELLKKISSKRVPYAALARDLEKQTENYSDASARLAQVKSRKDASKSIQLLTRIGEPWVGTRSDGLGKRVLSLVGGIAGLIVGLGLVMIVAPPFVDPTPGEDSDAAAPEQASVSEKRLAQQSEGYRSPQTAVREPQEPVAPAEPPVEPAPSVPPPLVPTSASVVTAAAPVVAVTAGVAATQTETPVTAAEEPAPVSSSSSPIQVIQIPAPAAAEPDVAQPPVQVSAPELVPVPPTPNPPTPSVEVVENVEPEEMKPGVNFVMVDQQSPTPTPQAQSTAPMPRPASKTLAAIFANMPQPKTDVTSPTLPEATGEASETSEAIDSKIEALAEELTNGSNTPESDENKSRRQSETIQLDDDQIMPSDSLQLQRRTAVVRPVDLARVDENSDDGNAELSRETIDSAFSQLEPSRPPEPEPESPSNDDIQNIFREDS